MNEDLKNLLITIISGVGVYVFSQWYTEFILQPIKEYKRLKAKAAKLLILHAQYYCNPWVYGAEGDCEVWKRASQEMRELAAEVAAFAEIKPTQILVLGAIPRKKDLLEAQSHLIGLSNSFFTSKMGMDNCIDRVILYSEEIKRSMGITHKKKSEKS